MGYRPWKAWFEARLLQVVVEGARRVLVLVLVLLLVFGLELDDDGGKHGAGSGRVF